MSLKYVDDVSVNGIRHMDSSDHVDSSSLEPAAQLQATKGTKEVAFQVGDSRKSSGSSVFLPNESDFEEDEEEALEESMELVDETSKIPWY